MLEVAEVVDAQLDAYFARDLERFIACHAAEIVITDAAGQVLAEGYEGLRQMYGPLFANSPNLAGRVAHRIVVGSYVADDERIEGFNLPGMPASIQALAVYQVADGKIARVALYF